MERSDVAVLSILSLMVVVALVAGAWHFWLDKDYPFVVEASCDPATETCFYRDCSVPDDCPPNGYENYKMYYVVADDFESCTDNSCETECTTGTIECEPIVCGEGEEDECAETPEPEPVVEDTDENNQEPAPETDE